MQNAMNSVREQTGIIDDRDLSSSNSNEIAATSEGFLALSGDALLLQTDGLESVGCNSGDIVVGNTSNKTPRPAMKANDRKIPTPRYTSVPAVAGMKTTMESLFKSVLASKDGEITRLEAICVKLRSQCNNNKQTIDDIRKESDSVLREKTRLQSIVEHQARILKANEDDSRQKFKNRGFLSSVQYGIFTVDGVAAPVDPRIYEINLRMEQLGEQLLSVTRERDMYKAELDKIRGGSSRRRGAPDPRMTLTDDQVAAIDAQWVRKLTTLKSKHEKIVAEYQITIKKLVQKETPSPAPVERPDESKVLRKRIEELESRIESVKTFYILKLKGKRKSDTSSAEKNENVPESRKPTRIVERLPTVYIKSAFNSIEGSCASNPPMEDSEPRLVAPDEWSALIRRIASGCDPEVLRRLLSNDSEVTPIDEDEFRSRIASLIDANTIDSLCSVYRVDNCIDVKLFLSDIFARCGDNVIDLEGRVSTLRRHVNTLMYELKDKIECIESGNAMAERGFLSPRGTLSINSQQFKHSLHYRPTSLIRE